MKQNGILHRLLALASGGLMYASLIAAGQAQTTNVIVAQFDTDTTGSFGFEFGDAAPTYAFDATANKTTTLGPNNPGSGSVDVSETWPGTGGQFQIDYPFPGGAILNLNNYTNFSFDVMFDTNCATDGAGSYGDLIVGFYATSQGYVADAIGTYNSFVTNGNGWIHVSIPINPNGNSDYNSVARMGFKMQQARTGPNIIGTTRFHLDNLILAANNTPPPPPKLSITQAGKVPAGLLMVPGEVGGDYTRELLATVGLQYSWIGSGTNPITYSTTIASYPGTQYPGFQSVIFFVPPGTLGDPGVDYDAANVAQLSIVNNGNGTATGSFQYKTNQPDGNSQFNGTGNLASITVPNIVGTWSVTFNNDTNITLTGPGGVSTNATFPDEPTAQIFANPMRLYYGCQQGGPANANAPGAIFSEFKVSGITTSPAIDDTFTEANLDTTNTWVLDASATGNIIIIPASPANQYWVNWTTPSVGFGLQVSTNLANHGGFKSAAVTHTVGTTTKSSVLVPTMIQNVPAGTTAFFDLVKRPFTQLQVLLPGETAAPGTPTGKTGTPLPTDTFSVLNVTVNAVDSQFNILPSIVDTISITTTGSSILPNNAALVNGTGTFQVLFQDGGGATNTVTATDITSTQIPPATSASIIVN